MKQKKLNLHKGFTLVEIVVAIGLVSLLLSAVLGLVAVSARSVDKTLSKAEGQGAVDAFVEEMSKIRRGALDGSLYDKAFRFCDGATGDGSKAEAVLVYKTNVELSSSTTEGYLTPVDLRDLPSPVPGVDYTEEWRVRQLSESPPNEFNAGFIAGPAYLIRFKSYEKNTSGDLILSAGYGEVFPDGGIGKSLAESVIFHVQAEVYKIPFIPDNDLDGAILDLDRYQDARGFIRPAYKENLAFRR